MESVHRTCHQQSRMAGPETEFCRAVAECVGPAVAGNVAGFKEALRAIPCVPESLRQVPGQANLGLGRIFYTHALE